MLRIHACVGRLEVNEEGEKIYRLGTLVVLQKTNAAMSSGRPIDTLPAHACCRRWSTLRGSPPSCCYNSCVQSLSKNLQRRSLKSYQVASPTSSVHQLRIWFHNVNIVCGVLEICRKVSVSIHAKILKSTSCCIVCLLWTEKLVLFPCHGTKRQLPAVLLLYSTDFPTFKLCTLHALNSTPLVHNAITSVFGRLPVVKSCLLQFSMHAHW